MDEQKSEIVTLEAISPHADAPGPAGPGASAWGDQGALARSLKRRR